MSVFSYVKETITSVITYISEQVKRLFTWLFPSDDSNMSPDGDIEQGMLSRFFQPQYNIPLPNGTRLKGPYRTLGAGAFGTVSEFKLNQTSVAVKQASGAGNNAEQTHEIELLKSANSHPNIITYIGTVQVESKVWIMVELMRGSVRSLLDINKNLSNQTKLSLGIQLLRGITHLHKLTGNHSTLTRTMTTLREAIVHQDLKTDNLLVSSFEDGPNIQLKISDFGCARRVTQRKIPFIGTKITTKIHEGEMKGTMLYMAPEVIRAAQKNETSCEPKSDTYSAGLILWEIMTGNRPNRSACEILQDGTFNEFSNDKASQTTSISRFSAFGQGVGNKTVPTYPKASFFGAAIDRCVQSTPSKRDSSREVLNRLENLSLN